MVPHSRTRFRRVPFLLVVVVSMLGLVVPWPGASAAQPGVDAWATSFPEALDHDLPAMTLPAEAFGLDGLIVHSEGELMRPLEEASANAALLGVDVDDLLSEMRQSGWRARYLSEVVFPGVDEDAPFAVRGWSSVTEYADEEGARDGYALLDETAASGAEVVRAREIGDGARMSRGTGSNGEGRTYERLRYTFLRGELVGSVALYWYDDTPSETVPPSDLVDAAEQLLERMDAASEDNAPGLSRLVLRPNGSDSVDVDWSEEGYWFASDEAMPMAVYDESPDDAGVLELSYRVDDVEAIYTGQTAYVEPDGDTYGPFVFIKLFQFANPGDAQAYLDEREEADDDTGLTDIVAIDEVPDLTVDAMTFSYSDVWTDGTEATGYLVWYRIGSTVVRLRADAPGGVALDDVFALAEAQAACLEAGPFCEPIEAPFGAAVDAGTPAARPGSATGGS